MKYIVFARELPNGVIHQVPVIFPEHLVHKDMARALLISEGMRGYAAVRAGFVQLGCELTAGRVTKRFKTTTYGESETLKKKSDPLDAVLIDTYQYTGGML